MLFLFPEEFYDQKDNCEITAYRTVYLEMWINELSTEKSTKQFVIFLGKQAKNPFKFYLNLAKSMKVFEWAEKPPL